MAENRRPSRRDLEALSHCPACETARRRPSPGQHDCQLCGGVGYVTLSVCTAWILERGHGDGV